jgi:hypothetical protein
MDGRMEEFVHLFGVFADFLKNMSAGLPNL